eukprot:4098874-Lingulodinium_polyedra.AAC.1
MPMLRSSRRRGPSRPLILAATTRPHTRAEVACCTHSGALHPSRTARIHWRPIRSKALSWSASVTAGQCRRSSVAACLQRCARGIALSPRSSVQASGETWLH